MKRLRLSGAVICLALALAAAFFGVGFSIRQVIFLTIAASLANTGWMLVEHAIRPPLSVFRRYQFRIGLSDLVQMAVDNGLIDPDEARLHGTSMYKALGKFEGGWITFTWLEPNLFYMHTVNTFSSHPELKIILKPYRELQPVIGIEGPAFGDSIEIEVSQDGYSLVFNAASAYESDAQKIRLIRLPITFFRALQDSEEHEAQKNAFTILKALPELSYWSASEVSGAWDFRGKYINFRWWDV